MGNLSNLKISVDPVLVFFIFFFISINSIDM